MPKSSVDPTAAEHALETAMKRYRKRKPDTEEQLRADRDDAIRAAIAAQVPRHRIIALTELSFQRIDQIRRGKRL